MLDQEFANTPAMARVGNRLSVVGRSLAVTAMCLLRLQRPEEAVPLAREAVATLRPHFLRNPGGLTPLMRGAAQVYIQTCQAAEVEPDASLFE